MERSFARPSRRAMHRASHLQACAVHAVVEQLESRVFLSVNPIVLENQKPGSPYNEWHINGVGDVSIQGFATDISVNHGQTVYFKIDDKDQAPYRLDIYRMGYYNGNGARKVATLYSSSSRQIAQPAGLSDPTTGLLDCGNWAVTDAWLVPTTAVSGIYFAKVTRMDTGGASHIVFIVRDDDSRSDMLFQTSDTTWQAYNNYGGKSIYDHQSGNAKASKISYNRPFNDMATDGVNSFVFTQEAPMVAWLEMNGYNVSYFTGVDTARYGKEILEHKVFLSVGHDEYWSGELRTNLEAARDAGVNLAFFSGNEGFWKIRWENSVDGTNTPYRTLVCYKESEIGAKRDPLPTVWTGTWRDPRLSPPADGGRPENALTGTIFMVNAQRNDPIYVPAEDGKLRFWRNTSVANLAPGETATFADGVLGYEWDVDLDNGFRPAGLIDLSHTTLTVDKVLASDNATYAPGTQTHSLTLYRASSGALVFGAGTCQWAWGLFADHNRNYGYQGPATADARMQQATVNLFADMSIFPGTLQAGLVMASPSTDFTPPTSMITWSPAGMNIKVGDVVTISGTASDGGGVVGGMEVSVDGGATWHKAEGRNNWQYTWRVAKSGTVKVLSRATDDSLRMETPGAGVTVNVQGPDPKSIWTDRTLPIGAPVKDTQVATAGGIELGMKFRSDVTGQVLGVRFFKFFQNTGVHTGSLWSSAGQLLATATFANETERGWQQVYFGAPVTIQAGQTYIVSYHTTTDYYPDDHNFFLSAGVDNGPLHALRSGVDGGNGVYRYGTGGFPSSIYLAANYYVDVLFTDGTTTTDTTPPAVVGTRPTANATGVAPTTNVYATFSEAVNPSTVSILLQTSAGATVAGTTTYDAGTRTISFQPSSPLMALATYTVRVSGATDLAGNVMAAPVTWSFSTAAVDTTAPTVVSYSPADSATDVGVTSGISVVFSEAIAAAGVQVVLQKAGGGSVAGTLSYNAATQTVLLQPSSALAVSTTYTVTVSGATDLAGNMMAAPVSWSFTTAAVSSIPISVWTGTEGPTSTTGVSDTQTINLGGVELGMKFRSSVGGQVLGVRFYKGAANTGVHTGSLWSSTGQLLATATFVNESSSGWQTVYFSSPVTIQAGQTYIVSYHTTTDRWVRTNNYFSTSSHFSGPLQALQNGIDGGNGVYLYGVSSGFPNSSYGAANYWVDVLFSQTGSDTTPPGIVSRSPNANATGVAIGSTVTVVFDEPINSATAALEVRDAANNLVAGTLSYNASTQTLTFRPTAALAAATTYTVTVSGATDLVGNVMAAPVSWSFTTAAVDSTPPTVVSHSPGANATNVLVSSSVGVVFSEAINASTGSIVVQSNLGTTVAGSASYNATTRTLTFHPNAALAAATTYTVTVSGAADLAGNVMAAPVTWSFTTAPFSTDPTGIWSDATVPTGSSAVIDPQTISSGGVELGMKFRSSVGGQVLGVRFYKGAANTGVHTGSLWSSTGQLLATATFVNETSSGWQTVYFSSPVTIQAGQTYIVSYHTTTDRWVRTNNYFASSATTNGPLQALQSGDDGLNGVYLYGAGGFPTNSYASANYWVDVLFAPA